MHNIRGKLIKFIALPVKIRLLFLEALLCQCTAWIMLKIVPFRKIPYILKNPEKPVLQPDIELLTQIGRVNRYAGHMGLWKNRCLVMSLSARMMCKKRKIASSLSLGFDISPGKQMLAHAWLEANNIELVVKNGEWKELYSF